MDILFLNPNRNDAMTRTVLDEARRVVRPGTVLRGLTAAGGPSYIGSEMTLLEGGMAALEALDTVEEPPGAIVLACFGDPGLEALRERAGCPVICMVDASINYARSLGYRPGIVTGGASWRRLLPPMLRRLGVDGPVPIACLEANGDDIARSGQVPIAEIEASILGMRREHGVTCAIIGGAALAGVHRRLELSEPIPVLDASAVAAAHAETLSSVMA